MVAERAKLVNGALLAWLLTAVFYCYQYVLRSAPAVMFPQLSEDFNISTIAVASVVGLFYYGYSPFSLVAGAAIDRLGPKTVVSAGALIAGGGAALFGTGNLVAARVGSFMEGAGGAFALVGAVYIASEGFPVSRAATLIGATQMFGMAGGWAGQFVIGPMITQGMPLRKFWVAMAALGLAVAVALYSFLPSKKAGDQGGDWLHGAAHSLATVFKNPQSILCGFIAGLLFIPTTIFSMIWGVRFLQDARGFEFQEAVVRSATVSLGWMIGCPLTGWLSDRIGLRRPVIIGGAGLLLACLLWTLYGPVDVLPPYVLSFMAGLSSGAAMLTYTVIKEANPPQFSGTATGVLNFINFTFSAVAGPLFAWIMEEASRGEISPLRHYQLTFVFLIYGIVLAILLTFALKETGRNSLQHIATIRKTA